VVELSDGSFVSGGWYWMDGQSQSVGAIWLSKVLASGVLDASFGNGGSTMVPWSAGDGQQFSKVIRVANQFIVEAFVNDAFTSLARFNADGSIDETFGTMGQVETTAAMYASGFIATSTGGLFACGNAITDESAFALFDSNGAADTSFAGTGFVSMNPITGSDGTVVLGCALDATGRVLALGQTYSQIDDSSVAFLMRMNLDGSLDSSFGKNGVTSIVLAPSTQPRCGPAIQSDGRIVVAFDAFDSKTNTASQVLSRYWN
jgi:uncharacterized delta-60 repeat protein